MQNTHTGKGPKNTHGAEQAAGGSHERRQPCDVSRTVRRLSTLGSFCPLCWRCCVCCLRLCHRRRRRSCAVVCGSRRLLFGGSAVSRRRCIGCCCIRRAACWVGGCISACICTSGSSICILCFDAAASPRPAPVACICCRGRPCSAGRALPVAGSSAGGCCSCRSASTAAGTRIHSWRCFRACLPLSDCHAWRQLRLPCGATAWWRAGCGGFSRLCGVLGLFPPPAPLPRLPASAPPAPGARCRVCL